jgi:hypothetical protein
MADRPAKLAKVAHLRRSLPHMSQSAFVAFLAAARDEPLPMVTRRDDLRSARALIPRRETPYGTVHQTIPLPRDDVVGGIFEVEVQSPWPMLHEVCAASPGLSLLIKQTLQRSGAPTPSRPWKVCLYSDEVDPGDPLLGKHARKFQACYWSILDFGAAALSHEELWFTVCTVRATIVKDVVGRMSGVMGALLRHMFCGLHDPKMAGILVHLHGEPNPVRLFIDFGMMTGDEASIQAVNLTRGASGEMPCMFCMNLKSKRSLDLVHDRAGYFVSSTETDLSKIKYHSDETVCAIHSKLQQKHDVEEPGQFVTTQKQLGFTYSIGSILLCPLLKTIYKPVSATVYDWMHCMLLEGVFSITVGEMMAELRPFKVAYQDLGEFVSKWTWPSRISTKAATGKDVFKPAKFKGWYKDVKFKTTASESLSLYPIMSVFFAEEKARHPLHDTGGITCFFLCCDVLDALQKVSRKRCTPEELAEVIVRFLKFFKLKFGEDPMTPKFHYIIHLPQMLRDHSIIFPCFVHERKHRELKRYAGMLRNTSCDFERSLLEDITNQQIGIVEDANFSLLPRLCHPLPRPSVKIVDELRHTFGYDVVIKIGKSARFSEWGIAAVGDLVLADVEGRKLVCELVLAIDVDGAVYFAASAYRFVGASLTSPTGIWNPAGCTNVFVHAECIVDTLVWSQEAVLVTVVRAL